MIRVSKSSNTPQSLLRTKSYGADDVVIQLSQDSHKKCYLCERVRDTDYNIEHYKSRENNAELVQEWSNLFFSCSYCNGKKLHHFDEILNPLTENIEDLIAQKIDFSHNIALFSVNTSSPSAGKTIELLNRIYNGTTKMRKHREEELYKYSKKVVNDFQSMALQYLLSPTEALKTAIQEALQIDKELLGFKYWIIKSNSELFSQFENDMIWNRGSI